MSESTVGKHSRKRHREDIDGSEKRKKSHRHRHKGDEEGGGRKRKKEDKHKRDERERINVVDEDEDEEVWIEKNIDTEMVVTQDIPTAESLKITSRAYEKELDPPLPRTVTATEASHKRDQWMLMPESTSVGEGSSRAADGPSTARAPAGTSGDFFSSLGTERKRKEPVERPDPDKMHVSSKEINPYLREGKSLEQYPAPKARSTTVGGPGSPWRMMKLRKVYEMAEAENRPVREVALDRFGSIEAFEEAEEERRILDEREGRRASRGTSGRDGTEKRGGEQRFVFSEVGAAAVAGRSSFRRPGSAREQRSGPSTPEPGRGSAPPPVNRRVDSLRLPSEASSPATASSTHTPIPSVMTPPPAAAALGSSKRPGLSTEELNKLQARVLKAKLIGSPDASRLEKEYEAEVRRANGVDGEDGGSKTNVRVEVLPTMDARGQLYDTGEGKADDPERKPGNRKKRDKVETHDPKTGEFVRYNADDDTTTLREMLRQEKFGAGMADQKDMDAQLARAIMSDGKFEDDLEYMDDNAERLGRKKMRSDAMKRQFAIHDYARTKRVLDSCPYCYGEDDTPPKAPAIAMGTRCYLACTLHEELVEGHCYIVPIQHHLSMLEGDDDLWDEIRNFMKCLMRMFAEEDKGVIFYETVLNIKWQKHTYIECVPVPWNVFEQLPAYFRQSILQSEMEWSQHKKLIDFSARPGGFRRAMVPNLPYFMVQWDYKGEKGYGHVIEGTGDAAGAGEADGAIDEGEKGGGEFPRYFAAEIIGNQLDIEPRRWRRPRRVDFSYNKGRVSKYRNKYDKYDWTGMIGKS